MSYQTQFNTEKLSAMFNQLREGNDPSVAEKASAYLKKIFNNRYPSQHELMQFNDVVVEQAEIIVQKEATDVLEILADVVRRPRTEYYQYTIPREHKAKWLWSANGTSVEHVRIGDKRTRVMLPTKVSTGMYYEVGTLVEGDVNSFWELVRLVADAKIQMYFQKVSELIQAQITAGAIPANNVLIGANITLAQYVAFANIFARHGGRPVFIADVELIDKLALQQGTDVLYKEFLYRELKRSLVEDLHITQIGRTTAINLVNPFIVGSGNTKTFLPRNEGYVFASGAIKPVKLVEFGPMKQYTEFDSDLEQLQIKITQEYALDFVEGELIGYVKDTAIQPGN